MRRQKGLLFPPPAYSWDRRRYEHALAQKILPFRLQRSTGTYIRNFGDMLGPTIASALVGKPLQTTHDAQMSGKLVSVGSVLHAARPGDVLWGTGRNGKIPQVRHQVSGTDIRAVRGPLTAQFIEELGVSCPHIFGDPGLLVSALWPDLRGRNGQPTYLIVPNYHDVDVLAPQAEQLGIRWISPRRPVKEVLTAIANASFVIGSSLHAMVVADSYGVDSRPVRSVVESPFKYADFYLGTGRKDITLAQDIRDAIALGPVSKMNWQPDGLLSVFPYDLYQ